MVSSGEAADLVKNKIKITQDCRGAVTVFVALLLLPTILVAGTAVDMARIYQGRSLVENGNQLVGNAVLTDYNPLLQERYALFALDVHNISNHQLTDYLNYCIFPPSTNSQSLLREFYAGTGGTFSLKAVDGYHLGNTSVLQNQMESYMSYRVSLILDEETQDFLNLWSDIPMNQDVLWRKWEIDKEICQLYLDIEKIYENILTLYDYPQLESEFLGKIDVEKQLIFHELSQLFSCYIQGENFVDTSENAMEAMDHMTEVAQLHRDFLEILSHVENLTLEKEGLLPLVEESIRITEHHIFLLTEMNDLLSDLESRKLTLQENVRELKKSLDSPDVSQKEREEISKSLVLYDDFLGNEQKKLNLNDESYTLLDFLLSYDGSNLGMNFYDTNISEMENTLFYLNNISIEIKLENNETKGITLEELTDVSQHFKLNTGTGKELAEAFSLGILQKEVVISTFIPFLQLGTEYITYFQGLESIFKKDTSITSTMELSGIIEEIEEELQDFFKQRNEQNFRGNSVFLEGAEGISTSFSIMETKSPEFYDISDHSYSEWLTAMYCSEFFSYDKVTSDKTSLSASLFSEENNYLYGSELEYLLFGCENSGENLKNVYEELFLLRFLSNYTSTYLVEEVQIFLQDTPTKEPTEEALLRLIVAMMESLEDVKILHQGGVVPSLKKNSDDSFRFIDNFWNRTEEFTVNIEEQEGIGDYHDYLLLLLLLEDKETIVERSGQLIEANINWFLECEVGSKNFELDHFITDFNIVTTLPMKFMFLSQPLARTFSNNAFKSNYVISVETKRGY